MKKHLASELKNFSVPQGKSRSTQRHYVWYTSEYTRGSKHWQPHCAGDSLSLSFKSTGTPLCVSQPGGQSPTTSCSHPRRGLLSISRARGRSVWLITDAWEEKKTREKRRFSHARGHEEIRNLDGTPLNSYPMIIRAEFLWLIRDIAALGRNLPFDKRQNAGFCIIFRRLRRSCRFFVFFWHDEAMETSV